MFTLDELKENLEFEDDWQNAEFDEAIDDLLLFEDLATGFDVITPTEYVAWVQRSLNRIYGSSLVTDGRKTASYRKLVRKFTGLHVYDNFRKSEVKSTFRFLSKKSTSLYHCKFALEHYKKSIKQIP